MEVGKADKRKQDRTAVFAVVLAAVILFGFRAVTDITGLTDAVADMFSYAPPTELSAEMTAE